MSHKEFQDKFKCKTQFTQYYGIVGAVKEYLKLSKLKPEDNTAENKRQVLKIINSVNKGTKNHYVIFNRSTHEPTCCERWNEKLNREINWKETFTKVKRIQDVRLKWFQIRLIHRIIATNQVLVKINVCDSDLCHSCKEKSESIQHIFWECHTVQRFWSAFTHCLKEKCIHMTHLKIDEEMVICGNKTNSKTDEVFDFILLLAKYYIYKCRLDHCDAHIQPFLMYLKRRYNIEKCISLQNMKNDSFQMKWILYQSLME